MKLFLSRLGRVLAAFTFILLTACPPKDKPKIEPEPEPEKPPVEAESKAMEIDTSDEVSFEQANLDAQLQKEIDEKLLPVYFEYNKYTLTSETVGRLGTAASFLNDHPNVRVLVEGHCDERGGSEYNMGLGENRARAVKNYLMNYGVPASQLEITSYGKEQPVNSNCTTETCHQQNRRAEFKVLAR
ncbi:MAG: OmpA family protein [Chitinivibrionales bacterium]|nr:OmpA family protein [Chitinivibrionales bacterium]